MTQTNRVYTFVLRHLAENGYPPNIAEIATGCALSAKAVRVCLNRLEANCQINRIPSKERSIRLTKSTSTSSLRALRW